MATTKSALDYYKFIHDNEIEFHWYDNEGKRDVILMPYNFQLEEFLKLPPTCIFDEEGVPATLKDGYVCIWMRYILEYEGIELKDIFGADPGE